MASELYVDKINGITGLTVNGINYPNVGPLSNRNLIINGEMQVQQRGTTFASSAFGGGRYTADRWNVPNRTRVAISSDVPVGFTSSLLIDREQTGGTEPFTISTGIEVQDIKQTGSYTLSFYAKSADVTTLNINVQDRTGVVEGGTNNSSIVTDEAITIDNTWTRYTHTFTLSSVSFTGTSLRISIGNTSAAQDAEALITGVQLEVGSVATPFEHRSFGQELALCQRYYYTIGPNVALKTFGSAFANSATSGLVIGNFPVTMRTSPSALEQSGTAANYVAYTGSTARTCSAVPVFDNTTTNVWQVIYTVASGQTTGQAGFLRASGGNSGFLAWSAEL